MKRAQIKWHKIANILTNTISTRTEQKKKKTEKEEQKSKQKQRTGTQFYNETSRYIQ